MIPKVELIVTLFNNYNYDNKDIGGLVVGKKKHL